ncbi:MAG: hypothetical protein K2X03_06430 [Bryobacteraceae bacterium]|nr:hypothetical protein [Bryobacteraceae bacterium]
MFRFLLFALLPGLLAGAPVRVLFVGNSYTYYNSLPSMVEELAQAAGLDIETKAFTRGGSTLLEMELHPELRALFNEKWDYVVLQEQSTLGFSSWNGELSVNDPAYFLQGARLLAQRAKASNAKLILYATWARKKRPEIQSHLDYGYQAAAREVNATIAPVGRAWAAVRELQPSLELFDPDGSHPSANGSYLGACVIMRTILGRPCTGLPGTLRGSVLNVRGQREDNKVAELIALKPDVAALLQRAADEATPEPGVYPPAPVPVFTSGHKPKSDEFSGRWKGRVFFYASPANFELDLKPDADACVGSFRLTAENGSWSTARRMATCQLTEQGIVFTLADPVGGATERHTLVFNSKGQINAAATVDYRTSMRRSGGTYVARQDGPRTSSR